MIELWLPILLRGRDLNQINVKAPRPGFVSSTEACSGLQSCPPPKISPILTQVSRKVHGSNNITQEPLASAPGLVYPQLQPTDHRPRNKAADAVCSF